MIKPWGMPKPCKHMEKVPWPLSPFIIYCKPVFGAGPKFWAKYSDQTSGFFTPNDDFGGVFLRKYPPIEVQELEEFAQNCTSILTPPQKKNLHDWLENPPWMSRCISSWKWWIFHPAMLVFAGVYFVISSFVNIFNFSASPLGFKTIQRFPTADLNVTCERSGDVRVVMVHLWSAITKQWGMTMGMVLWCFETVMVYGKCGKDARWVHIFCVLWFI